MSYDDEPNSWEFENKADNQNEWPFSDGCAVGPAITIEKLRDDALDMFDSYLSFRTKIPPVKRTAKLIAMRRKYLSLDETENIVKEFNCGENLPDGMSMIGANSVAEMQQKLRTLLNALMNRIMSNLVHDGVNHGLIDCAFDSEADAFAFAPTEKGEKLIKKLRKRKKKTKDDSED